jgi:polyisoprenoid-binding protein YceI
MKAYSQLVLALAIALTTALQSAPARAANQFALDTAHTSIVFSVSHLNMSYTYGMFRQYNGGFVFDRENPDACQFQFTIDANSIDTNNEKRDQHLRSPDFFNVREFPTITFVSTACTPTQNQQGKPVYQVTGNLTMLGQSRPVTIPLELLGEGTGPDNKFRVGFLGLLKINRSDFGMANMVGPVGDAVSVTISFEGVQQD